MNYQQLNKCLCCNGSNLNQWLDLGNQPPANNYVISPTNLEQFPLQVNFCNDCTHNQLSVSVNPEILFKYYLYVSGTTITLKNHFKNLAIYALYYRLCKAQPYILDIASNDGTLLNEFKKLGCYKLYGVDPAENLASICKEKDINVNINYWSSNFADFLCKKEGIKFNIITACNVLAHNYNPYDFLLGCRKALSNSGIIIIEFPYGKSTIELNDFGQIYHEHLQFFNIRSFTTLCDKLALKIVDINFFSEIHGGTIRFTLSKKGKETKNFYELRKIEQDKGLWDLKTYFKFSSRINQNINNLYDKLQFLKDHGYKIICYAASAKLSTLLNYDKRLADIISYIVDDNPLKCSRYTPGSNVPIFSTNELLKENQNLVIIVTAHNFKDEIKNRLQNIGIKGKLLNYVPEVYIEDI